MSRRRCGPTGRARQAGAALILLAALVVLGVSWMIVSALGNAARNQVADQGHNAGVLREARAALVGWMAMNALDATEDNPGRLPCPQAWGDIGTANEGRAASFCAVPAAGLLPYKTLGLPRLLDSAGQQLWYVVSPGWHLPNSMTDLVINSNTAGQLTLDGQANAAVALIIAPGRPLSIVPNATQAAAGCAARSQSHEFGGALNVLNFLDCHNASTADATYVTSVVDNATNPVFNDQVLAVTTADVLPPLEAAISKRIERDIVPTLRDIYASPNWWLPAPRRWFPYAAQFLDPTGSNYAGAVNRLEGLLPFNFAQRDCDVSDARCQPATWSANPPQVVQDIAAGGSGFIKSLSCAWDGGAVVCAGEYQEDADPAKANDPQIRLQMSATVSGVALGLRTLAARVEVRNDVVPLDPWQAVVLDGQGAVLNPADGTATITFGARLPNIDAMVWGSYAQFRVRLSVADHWLLSGAARQVGFVQGLDEMLPGQVLTGATSGALGRVAKVVVQSGSWSTGDAAGTIEFHSVSNGQLQNGEQLRLAGADAARVASSQTVSATSWFARNEWYRFLYYALGADYALSGSGNCAASDAGTTFLTVSNLSDSGRQCAVLALLGRGLSGQGRPSNALSDYLEGDENRDGDAQFEQLAVGAVFNDRFISVGKNP